jgi:hypothetical protein
MGRDPAKAKYYRVSGHFNGLDVIRSAAGPRIQVRNFDDVVWPSLTRNPSIQGPGIFATCARGRERKAEQELYDLLNQVRLPLRLLLKLTALQAADRLYPVALEDAADEAPPEDDDIEAQIAQEVSDMKTAKRKGKHRFSSKRTDCECILFISCAPPCDPLKLVELLVTDLLEGKPARSR